MMIKCQKCGFENQMGSIFCRSCGEKLDMDAIDPNKLQKDVNKEKNIKLAKKRIKSAISTICGLLVVGAFLFAVFYTGRREQTESGVSEEAAKQKYNAVVRGNAVGTVKYTYPEINQMFKTQVLDPLSEIESFAKVTGFEMAYDNEKKQPVAYIWIKIKEKVPVLYIVHGNFVYNVPPADAKVPQEEPITVDVKRLDIGYLPVYVSTHTFLNGLNSLVNNGAMQDFFQRAGSVEFNADGMTVEFRKGSQNNSMAAPSSLAAPGSAGSADKSAAAAERAEAARQKAEEEKAKKEQLAEERKRKAEEEAERKRQKEEERKQKIEEEKERKRQAEEERKRRIEEENERRRQEAEDRRREREERRRDRDNGYGNGRSSRSSRNSRNNRW